jgi:hypothetical protein
LGTLLTLWVFVAANAGALLLALARLSGGPPLPVIGVGVGSVVVLVLMGWRMPRSRTYLPIPWALILLLGGLWLSANAPDDRRVIFGSAILTMAEVTIIAAVATLFASFSSPFLTAVFTFGLFLVGRSADTLAHLPHRVFGQAIKTMGSALSKVLPNLMLYVPPRPLLTGESAGASLSHYVLTAIVHAIAWAVGLLAVASLIFRRRDFL